jgi:hypothetical protein
MDSGEKKKGRAAGGKLQTSKQSLGDKMKSQTSAKAKLGKLLVTESSKQKPKLGKGRVISHEPELASEAQVAQSSGQHSKEERVTKVGESVDGGATTSLKRRLDNEIDSIFGNAKKKVAPESIPGKPGTSHDEKGDRINLKDGKRVQQKRQVGGGEEKQKVDQKLKLAKQQRARKKTSDGLTVYSEEELGFGKKEAGGTPLCPFDCHCCF